MTIHVRINTRTCYNVLTPAGCTVVQRAVVLAICPRMSRREEYVTLLKLLSVLKMHSVVLLLPQLKRHKKARQLLEWSDVACGCAFSIIAGSLSARQAE